MRVVGVVAGRSIGSVAVLGIEDGIGRTGIVGYWHYRPRWVESPRKSFGQVYAIGRLRCHQEGRNAATHLG